MVADSLKGRYWVEMLTVLLFLYPFSIPLDSPSAKYRILKHQASGEMSVPEVFTMVRTVLFVSQSRSTILARLGCVCKRRKTPSFAESLQRLSETISLSTWHLLDTQKLAVMLLLLIELHWSIHVQSYFHDPNGKLMASLSPRHTQDESPLTHQAASSWAQSPVGPSSGISIFVYSSQLCSVAVDPLYLSPWNCVRGRKRIFYWFYLVIEKPWDWPNYSTRSCLGLPTCKIGSWSRWHE